jgi:uncharacterized membrane protein (DUF373 family)
MKGGEMKPIFEKIERGILWVLAVMLLIGVIFETVDLITDFFRVVLTPPLLMIEPEVLFHMFGGFLIALMGLKLIKLVLLSLPGESSPIMAVIEVALIGVGQKVVTMEIKTLPASTLLGTAALVLALAVAYWACWFVQAKSRQKVVSGVVEE